MYPMTATICLFIHPLAAFHKVRGRDLAWHETNRKTIRHRRKRMLLEVEAAHFLFPGFSSRYAFVCLFPSLSPTRCACLGRKHVTDSFFCTSSALLKQPRCLKTRLTNQPCLRSYFRILMTALWVIPSPKRVLWASCGKKTAQKPLRICNSVPQPAAGDSVRSMAGL